MTDDTALVLKITRIFDAPRTRVFDAWTNLDSGAGWWGPKGFTRLFHEIDLRPGGRWRLGMRSPDGKDHVSAGIYREIVPPGRLVMTHGWEGADGHPGPETVVTITLTDRDGRTEMTFEQTGFDSLPSRDSHREGWTEAFDMLEAGLERVLKSGWRH
jgi:uncharacterized protein YndB with AHSA1/START domain